MDYSGLSSSTPRYTVPGSKVSEYTSCVNGLIGRKSCDEIADICCDPNNLECMRYSLSRCIRDNNNTNKRQFNSAPAPTEQSSSMPKKILSQLVLLLLIAGLVYLIAK